MAKLPTPQRLVNAPGPQPIVEPRGYVANTQAAAVAGQIGQQISDTFYQVAAKDAEKKGIDAANSFLFDKDPVTGRIIPPKRPNVDGQLVPNIYDQAYHKQLTTRYEEQIVISAKEAAHAFALENPHDKAKFDTSWQTYIDETLTTVPDDIRGTVDGLLSNIGVPYGNSIATAQAEINWAVSKKQNVKFIDSNTNELKQLILSGATEEELLGKFQQLNKNIDSYVANGTFTEEDKLNVLESVDRQLAFSKIERGFKDKGIAPGSEAGQQELVKIMNQIIDGSLPISLFNKKGMIGNLLNEQQRTQLASQVNSYASRYAEIERLREARMRDAVFNLYTIPAYMKAMMNGEVDSFTDIRNTAESLNDPEMRYEYLTTMNAVRGVAERTNTRIANIAAVNNAITFTREIYGDNPQVNALVEQLTGASLEENLGLADILNKEFNTAGANRVMSNLDSITRLLKDPTKAEVDFQNLMQRHADLIISKQNYCKTLPDGQTRNSCFAEANSIPLPSDATKDQKEMAANLVQNMLVGNQTIDWYGVDEEAIIKQTAVVDSFANIGAYSHDFVSVLGQTITNGWDLQNPEQMEAKLQLFQNATKTQGQRTALQNALGDDLFSAYDILSREAGVYGLNNQILFDRVQNMLNSGVTYDAIYTQQDNELVNAAFTNTGSDVFDGLNSDNQAFIAGDIDTFFVSNQLRAHPDLQQLAYTKALTLSGVYESGDMDDMISVAINAAKRNAVDSYRYMTNDRAALLLRQGYIDSLGRDNPALQPVPSRLAPESNFPSTDNWNPEAIMFAFDKYAEGIASKYNSDYEWKMGVNLGVILSEDLTGNTGPVYRLVGINEIGEAVQFEGNTGVVDFNPVYNQMKAGTRKNLEKLTDIANARKLMRTGGKIFTLAEKRKLAEEEKRLKEAFMVEME